MRRVGLDGRRLEYLDRLLVVSLRGEEKPPATIGERTEPRVRLSRVLVEQAQQPLRCGKVVDGDQRLDPTEPASRARNSSSS